MRRPAACCRRASRTIRVRLPPIRSTSRALPARASGTSTATSTSTTSAATARCSSAIRIRRSSRRCSARRRSARTGAPRTSSRCAGPSSCSGSCLRPGACASPAPGPRPRSSRWSRSGAPARYGIVPELPVLAKILAGGLPVGAVAGVKDILDQLDPAAATAARREKIGRQGTFNANPLCAAAGVAALTLVEAGDACARAEAAAGDLRAGLRRILVEEGVPWGIFGEASVFVIFPNPARLPVDPASFDPLKLGFKGLKGARDPQLNNRLRIALLAHGVDIAGGPGGFVAAVHGGRELSQTLDAFLSALRALKAAGSL